MIVLAVEESVLLINNFLQSVTSAHTDHFKLRSVAVPKVTPIDSS